MKRYSVYIVEENVPVMTALADRLSLVPDIQVLGYGSDDEQAFNEIMDSRPDVVLIEVKRTDGMGFELLRKVAALSPKPKIFVLTSYPSEWEEDAAKRAGANGYLLKNLDSQELIGLISEP